MSCYFVLRDAASQTKNCCSPKIKTFGTSNIFSAGYAADWRCFQGALAFPLKDEQEGGEPWLQKI